MKEHTKLLFADLLNIPLSRTEARLSGLLFEQHPNPSLSKKNRASKGMKWLNKNYPV